MIQRIQSLYLLITFALTIIMFCLPFGTFLGGQEGFTLSAWAIKNSAGQTVVPTTPMGILLLVCSILSFFTIFLYRHRWVQLRFCVVGMVLYLGLQAFVVFYTLRSNSAVSQADIHSMSYSVTCILPLVCLILTWLAFRGVLKDETLVKSLERIR